MDAAVRHDDAGRPQSAGSNGRAKGVARLARGSHDATLSRASIRPFTQASTSASTQPAARSPIFTGAGNSPRCTLS